ncbi:MAG: WD40 repeat domain-containing protein [Gemmatimonadota bacterium]|nr:WD40 repeat domain-containing protein [Gemmatimonadota bacterium]
MLTSGDIDWDDAAGDFAWDRTTALPPTLRGVLTEEPRFVDLRWARHEDHISLANARFAEAVADVAAALQGRPKDDLLGEDVRQHRRTRRVVRIVIASLSILLVGAVAASVIAVRQRDRAEEQARIATSRLLAAEALTARDDELDLAFLLAAQAYAIQDNAQSRASIVQVLLRSPYLVGFLQNTTGATTIVYDSGARSFAVGNEAGTLALWDARTFRKSRKLEPGHRGAITALAFSADGRLLASGGADGKVGILEASTGRRINEFSADTAVMSVTLGRGSGLVAASSERGVVHVWSTIDGRLIHRFTGTSTANPRLAFDDDGMLVAADGQGWIARWSLSTGAAPDPSTVNIGSGQPVVSAYTADLRLFAALSSGQRTAYVTDTRSGSFLHDDNLVGPALNTDVMAFSASGAWLATAGEGRVVMWDVRRGVAVSPSLNGILGRARAVALAGERELVAVAAGRGVAVWRPNTHGLARSLSAQSAVPLADVPNVLRGAASAAFSPDGTRLAWSVNTVDGSWVVVWDVERQEEIARVEAESVVGFSADGRQVAASSDFEKELVVVDVENGARRPVAQLPPTIARAPEIEDQPWTAVSSTGLGASIAFDGTVTLWNVESRQPIVQIAVPGAFDFSPLVFDAPGRRLAIASPGGALTLIDVAVDVWRARVCAIAGRDLSDAEWRQHVGSQRNGTPACP